MIVGGGYLNLNLQSKNNINHEIFTRKMKYLAGSYSSVKQFKKTDGKYFGLNLILAKANGSYSTSKKTLQSKTI